MYNEDVKSLNSKKNGGIEHPKAGIKLIPLKQQTRK